MKPSRGAEPGTSTGAAERQADGVVSALAPGQEGNPEAVAAAMPGTLAVPDGFSVLGLNPSQNNTTLNGLAFGSGDIPRSAAVRARVSTSTYDPARGGFAGAQVALELSPGSTFSLRRSQVALDAKAASLPGVESTAVSTPLDRVLLSAGGEGELVEGRYFYNGAVQVSRRSSDPLSVHELDARGLSTLGADPDSIARLLRILPRNGLPAVSAASLGTRTSDHFSLLGRIDRTPAADRTWGITAHASLARAGLPTTPTATLGYGARSASSSASLHAQHSLYFRRYFLNETKSGLTISTRRVEPDLALPSGIVLVTSARADGTSGSSPFYFGGQSGIRSANTEWSWEVTNQTAWHNWGNAHRLMLFLSSRLDGYAARSSDQLGTFTYRSLAELEANRPARFTRELGRPDVAGGQWNGVLAMSDHWRTTSKLRVLYGARIERNQFIQSLPLNRAVLETFGARTDRVPNTFHVSPRLGFTWFYGAAPSYGVSASPLGTRYQLPHGVLRGGVGEFRSLLRSSTLAGAQAASGLSDSRHLDCVGPAVPTPDWRAYTEDSGRVPTQCAGDSDVPEFSERAAQVDLFSRDFAPARSWRANLAWSPHVKGWTVSLEGIYSLNLDQPSWVDLNFNQLPRFTLPNENDRAVYVGVTDIVPETGIATSAGSRRSADFARVTEHRSDLRSVSRQLVLNVSPDLPLSKYALGFAYALADSRGQQRGSDNAHSFDARAVERTATDFDMRHQLTAYTGVRSGWASATLWGRIGSGLPFTPVVSGDVNGDGRPGDRAFIFDPGAPEVDRTTAEGIRALLANGHGIARECIESHLGERAPRNGCRGPWTRALHGRVVVANPKPSSRGRFIDRATVSIHAHNLIDGLDRVVNGRDRARGWGMDSAPDPVLYYVRGFDPAQRRYTYEVNPEFGQFRRASARGAVPFRLTLDLNVRMHRPIAQQQLERFLKPGRAGDARPRLPLDSIKQRYSRNVPDLYARIIQESDSLLLTFDQVASLRAAQVSYRTRVDSVWTELASYLAQLPDRYNSNEALLRQEAATDRAWELSRQEGPSVRAILSPLQISLLPGLIRTVVEAKEPVRVRVYSSP